MSQTKRRKSRGKSPQQIEEEMLVELRDIINYRKSLLQPTDKLAYEEKQKELLAFAGCVYHFRERLTAWLNKSGILISPTVDEIARQCVPLLVCGDLFNAKKHSGNDNLSNLQPILSEMSFKTPSGGVGIFFDGIAKTGELTRPVDYVIQIRCGDGRSLGKAVDYIAKAFVTWLPVMERIGLLSDRVIVEQYILSELRKF